MTFELRGYQREAIDALYQYWIDGRGEFPLIVAPTGSGKTALISQIIKDAMDFPDTRVMVLTHVKELLEQGAQEVLELYPECDFAFYSAGIGQKRLDKPVTFAGIQSIWQRAFDMIPPPDLVLIDEAHMLPKSTETRYGRFISDLRQCNPQIKIIGLTATPYRLDSGMLHEGAGAVFDGIAYDIPVGRLMDEGYLSPVVSRAGHREIDLSDVKMRGGEFVESDLAIAASDPELVRATVAEIVELGADRKAWLVFASGIAHARMLAEEMADTYGIDCAVVTGSDAKAARAKAIEDFRSGKTRCLINCNVLTTGFNVKHVDLVAMVRATASTGLYVQMVGRGTRIAPGKTDCLVLDYGGNVARHGFIDQVNPKKAGASGDGEAPAKKCPQCDYMLPTAVRVCSNCGHEFPAPALNHGHRSYEGAMMSSQVKREWLDVDDVTYSRWQGKEGKPDTLRVTYRCGLAYVSEWMCPDHGGYAAEKYRQRLPVLGGMAMTLEDALYECRWWKKPRRICVMPDGKFQKIVQIDYSAPSQPSQKEIDLAAQRERDLADFM
ncbi:MAG: DEAD/DEAH box helicase [Rhodobacteraceae bacterium]|nr:DEAD/DEAH box helicase [Paracoccaceae bacterium]